VSAPTLKPAALYGLAGEVVRTISAESEADQAALLVTFLTSFGSAVGAGPHAKAGGAAHPARLFSLIVGDTARSRKGTSWADMRPVLAAADSGWTERVLSGFGSGEAIIDALRDPLGDDPGVADKRALVREGEFVRILRVVRRDGSTLGPIIRDAWDGERLVSRTVGRGERVASGAHVSVLAHVTAEELERELLDVDVVNGMANRFLIVCARRAQKLPSGGNLDDSVVADLGRKVRERLGEARKVGILRRTPEAAERWDKWYCSLPDDVRGMFGAVTARVEAQVLRLSVVYALTDGARQIGIEHLEAALALWGYCEDSARHLFQSTTGDPTADRLYDALRARKDGSGLDGKEQHQLFAGHRSARQLHDARELLESLGLAETVTTEKTGGRPRIVTFANSEQSESANNQQASFASSLSSQSVNGDRERVRASSVEEGFE
jgi:hypothetical protein